MSDVVIGIDLGTTNSCVAAVIDGQPMVIPNPQRYRTTPSMYALGSGGQPLVGSLAKRQQVTNPTNTVYAAKRLIGRRFDSSEVQRARKLYPYTISAGPHGDARVRLADRDYAIPEIAAKVLADLKHGAERYLGHAVAHAVITVPAFFNDNQRQATKDAGKIAGLEVLRIINEPTAAAIAYGLMRGGGQQRIVVYDLGGGTFDVSILALNRNVFEVVATAGDTFLGGEDIDLRILEELLMSFHATTGINLGGDRLALQRLRTAAEEAKMALSFEPSTRINLPFIAVNADNQPVHFDEVLTREQLEDWARPLIARSMDITQKALEMAKLTVADVDDVVLVGGQTRMPLVQGRLTELFGKAPRKGINPDEAVALGAAVHAASLTQASADLLLMDVTPLSLGISAHGDYFAKLIERNTPVPCKRSHTFTTVCDGQERVNIRVLQGEADRAADNELLGEFVLTGIPPALRGEPKIEVLFSINAEGIVSVSAKDMGTGRRQAIEVKATSGLTEGEVAKMAEAHNDEFDVAFHADAFNEEG